MNESQHFSGRHTSVNKIKLPAIYRKLEHVGILSDVTLIDYGCGKFTEHIAFFCEMKGCIPYFYDPFNLPEHENRRTLAYAENNRFDIAICSNVLNVIDNDNVMCDIISTLAKWSHHVFVSTYEGDGSGIGKQTGKDQYQRNMKTTAYLPYIYDLGYTATVRNKIIYMTGE